MTTPTILRRDLTFNAQQAITVTSTGQQIKTIEVCVIPLADPSNAAAIATYVGGLQSQTVELVNENNPVVFSLVPSNAPGLSETVNYRIMWREGGVTGRTFTYDFAMPDEDVNFDQIQSLGDVIDGQAYLQQTDLSKPGRVCQLNNVGIPTDSNGDPVAGASDITALTNLINNEITAREAADQLNLTTLQNDLETQINASVNTAENNLDEAVSTLTTYAGNNATAITTEVTRATAAETTLHTSLTTYETSNDAAVATINTALGTKADLVGGVLKSTQIPPQLLLTAYQVANQAAMLALSPTVNNGGQPPVHYADIAVWANGSVWMLLGNPAAIAPATLGNWLDLTAVVSVNGHQGVVTLAAADVGAIAVGASIGENQVTGLTTDLALLAPLTTTASLQTQITAITSDTTYVKTMSGVIPHALNDSSMAYVNNLNQVTKKDGTVLSGGAGGGVASVNNQTGVVTLAAADVGAIAVGASILQSQVTGLAITLSGYVLTGDSRMTNARTPTAHAASHASAGSDPLTLAQSQITGLSAIISGNQLASNTNAINRIGTLETLVAGGGGGGGGGTPSTTTFWTNSNITSDVTDFSTVSLHSPFGVYTAGGSIGTPYYNYNGVLSSDVAYAYVTPNGHLKMHVWNESGPADPVYALESDFLTLSGNVTTIETTIGTLATQTALTTATTAITALQTGKADLVSGTVPLNQMSQIIPLSYVFTLVSALAAKADLSGGVLTAGQIPTGIPQASVSGLVSGLALKADLVAGTVPLGQLPTNIPATSITGLPGVLTNKADLVTGTVPLNEMPQNIPQSYVVSLVTNLAAKADLSGGVLTAAQIPTGIPQASVSGLTASLAAKADLSGGFLQLAEVPFGALNHVVVVANQAAMLALTTSQVHVNDLAVITGTSAQGTYALTALPASTAGNWQYLAGTPAPVASVNGYTGIVNLAAADVGAMASNAVIPASQVAGLVAFETAAATQAQLATAILGVTTPAQVQNMLSTSQTVRAQINYVATGNVPSTSGQQSVDGVVMALNSVVLLTAQVSSIQNGPWVVNSGAWTRPQDMNTGTFFVKDTIFIVSSGNIQANTIWQQTATSGTVDFNAQNYTRIAFCGPPPVYTAAANQGLSVTNNAFSAVPGPGVVVTNTGIGVDFTKVPGKFVGTVPSGNTLATITHNLNTVAPTSVTVIESASGNMRLVPWAVSSANSITLAFLSAPGSSQYFCAVSG